MHSTEPAAGRLAEWRASLFSTSGEQTGLALSVVIPTFNRCRRLRRLLVELNRERLGRRPFEVVVVVDGANDGTLEMLQLLRPVYPLQVLSQANAGPAAARNRGIEAARGELLLFLDDDVIPQPDLLSHHLAVHERAREAAHVATIGPMVPSEEMQLPPWLRWEAAMLQKQYAAMLARRYPPTPRQFWTANAMVRRADAIAVGGFDERFLRAEDVEFAYRLARQGVGFVFVPEAAVLHEPDRTYEAWLRVGYEYGRHDVRMVREAGHEFVLRQAQSEWKERHMLTRAVTRWSVGHGKRRRFMLAATRAMMRSTRLPAIHGVQMALCSVVFNAQYWQGVADSTGEATRIWDRDIALRTTKELRPTRRTG